MINKQIKTILNELIEKSKDFKVGFIAPEEYKVKITELENFDFILFSELENINRVLLSSESNYFNKKETISVPVLKLDEEYVTFYPSIIREFQKEL